MSGVTVLFIIMLLALAILSYVYGMDAGEKRERYDPKNKCKPCEDHAHGPFAGFYDVDSALIKLELGTLRREVSELGSVLKLLETPCLDMVAALTASGKPRTEWPEGTIRIADVLEAIEAERLERNGLEVPANMTRLARAKAS